MKNSRASLPRPADDAARRRFIDVADRNFCVCAGAGAGKTTAITKRIVALASQRDRDPRLLSKLVVVTYTVLAAEELRIRTRQELLSRFAGPDADKADKSAFSRQDLLRDLRGAYFGTIHSFCLKLIREFGGPLGLPGKPELAEERDLDEEWERFSQSGALDDLSVPDSLLRHVAYPDLLRLARDLATDNLAAVLKRAPPGQYPAPPDPSNLDPSKISNFKARAAAESDCIEFRAWLEELKVPGAFAPLPSPTTTSREFVPDFNACLAELRQWISQSALLVAAAMAERFRAHRFADGHLTYADQIRCARALLEDPEILREMRARGWRVILDEAQDTDRAMFEILTEITRPRDAPLGTWPESGDGPEPGRFSFVGDEQQSIYSDRAEPADYRRYVSAYAEGRGGESLPFDVTMRCAVSVVDSVNAVFADGIKRQAHVEFRPLKPRPAAQAGAVWRIPIPDPPNGVTKVDPKFAHEANHVGRWLQERGPAFFGVESWSDFAVIAPRRKWLTAAAQVWEQAIHIPIRELSTNQTRLESPAISWPVALLHVLLDPWDRFELLGVLREIFAVSDRELALQHLSAGLNFWPELPVPGPGVSARLGQALQCLHDFRRRMVQEALPAGAFLAGLIGATQLDARLRALDYSADSLVSLRAQALAAECAGLSTRTWVRSLVESLDQPLAEASDGIEAVNFLTCQKAKGLEWPVVLLLGFGRAISEKPHTDSFPRVQRDGNGDPFIELVTSKDEHAQAQTRSDNADEWQRFLYVTMTRAKQCLVLPDSSALYANPKAKASRTDFAGLIRWKRDAPLPAFPDAPPPTAPPLPHEASQPVIEIPLIELNSSTLVAAVRVAAQIPQAQTPSRFAHEISPEESADEDEPNEPTDPLEPDLVPLLVGVGGKGYGTWWHDTLQQFPWKADAMVRKEFLARRGRAILDAEEWRNRGLEETAKFAGSLTCREIIQAGMFFLPEIPFAHAIAGDPPTWVEGILDLLVLRADGTAWIIDWKTDRRREQESAEKLLDRLRVTYAVQLHAYAAAIRNAGREVSRCTIYSTVLGVSLDC